MTLKGKRVLVTGGTGALGQAIALDLLERGAWVAVTYRDRAEADALLERCANAPCDIHALPCDLTDPASVDSAARAVLAGGVLDGLVLAAGTWDGGHPVWEAPADEAERLLRTNFLTAVHPTRAFVPGMVEAGGGAVVSVGSRIALRNRKGSVLAAASKAALVALTEGLAEDLKGTGVSAFCVLPSTIDTPANRAAFPDADPKRWVAPERIAAVIAWLLDAEASVASGAVVPVYGDA